MRTAWNQETFEPHGTLGRDSEREVVLVRALRTALARLNPDLPEAAREQAVEKLTRVDFSRSLVQHNREYYGYIRGGVPVEWRDARGETHHTRARVVDFRTATTNRFLAVRELKIQGVRVPHYNRRADLVCFVNGLPLVFIELKAVYKNIRAGFDDNLTDYMHEHSIAHAFHHSLDAEQRRAAEEGLSNDEYALFQMLFKDNISRTDHDKLKQASQSLLASLRELLTPTYDWTKNTSTQAEVKVFILDTLWQNLPRPPFTEQETAALASRVYDDAWQRSASGDAVLAA